MMERPYILGLTGSIGMGKTTTAGFFRDAGVPVWDADATVHRLYMAGGAGARAIEALAPAAIRDGAVDRSALRKAVMDTEGLLEKIEAAVHPIVAEDRLEFIETCEDAKLIVCDIPLLFETSANLWLDGVLVVTADKATQKQRVMEREGMTEEVFDTILAKQMPDNEKRERADFLIDTSEGMDHARADVLSLIERLTGDHNA